MSPLARSAGVLRAIPGGLAAPLASVLLLAGLSGCSQVEASGPLDLARLPAQGTLPEGEVAPGIRVEPEGDDLWLVATVSGDDWEPVAGLPGRFRAPMSIQGVGAPRDGGAPWRLVAEGTSLVYEADHDAFGARPGSFSTGFGRGMELQLAAGDAPPAEAELWGVVDYQGLEDGTLRVAGRRISGAGFWVPDGHPRTLEVSIPPGSALRFATTVETLLAGPESRRLPQVFRVRLDGVTVFEEEVEIGLLGEVLAWHTVELPAGGVRSARLEFEVEGPLALTTFLAPRIAARDVGTYAGRPWDRERPDLVVFLADTCRADNLAAYGGTLGLTPAMDRFAEGARVFTRAWSTSTHTLPAHSSMFSGVFPPQNGQVDLSNPLPAAVDTLAERLGALGYRCGAVTDGVMVSVRHGMAQGFESFDERRGKPTANRVRAFLDADDGRPMFLFVQSYAAHTPYAISEETRATWDPHLALDRELHDVKEDFKTLPPLPESPPADGLALEVAQRLRDLYRAAVVELDLVFADVYGHLEARGVLAEGVLVLASDHGEAFLEHGRPFHTNRVFEEELRIPLVLAAPGIAPGRDARPVSLIDLSPTLAELAGLPRAPLWEGHSLLDPPQERTLYAFQTSFTEDLSTLAVIDGTRKLIGYQDPDAVRAGDLHAAFDLERDPAEVDDLLEREAWPRELLERERARLEELLTPLVAPETSVQSGETLRILRAMGYAGGE